MNLSSTVLIDSKDISQVPFMQNLQGNILKGHGRDHTANLFFRFRAKKQRIIKEKLGELGECLTSLYKQLFDREMYKRNGKNADTFLGAYLTAEGYKYLGFEDIDRKFQDQAFLEGLFSRTSILSDPPKNEWESGYRGSIHLMVLVANDDLNLLTNETRNWLEHFKGHATLEHIEYGHVLRNEHNDGIEHFGYADGISQPLFLKDEVEDYFNRHNCPGNNQIHFDPSSRLDIALVKDPFPMNGYEENSFGSYFVYRKLEQNVQGFKEMEHGLKNNAGKDLGEIAGAYLVGRFEDGTPVALTPEEGLIDAGSFNNFNYKQDKEGLKCPYFAHIRVTNPRQTLDTGKGEACFTKPSIVRRGIPFGYRHAPPMVELDFDQMPVKGVGLLFMCFQASIVEQFEKMQIAANSSHGVGGSKNDIDPIIGQLVKVPGDPDPNYAFPEIYGKKPLTNLQPFKSFVEMKGGAYFFAPSIQFFKNL